MGSHLSKATGGVDKASVLAPLYRTELISLRALLAVAVGDLDLAEKLATETFAMAVHEWARDGVPERPGDWLADSALRHLSRTPETPDDALIALLFACCAPSLPHDLRVAMTLRLACGVEPEEVNSLVTVPTDEPRDTAIQVRPLTDREIDDQIECVLAVITAIYELSLAGSGGDPFLAELGVHAASLAQLVHARCPDEPEVAGLLAQLT